MKQPKILLYRPHDYFTTEENGSSNYIESPNFPYGMAMVAGVLRNANYFVEVYDAFAQNHNLKQTKEKIIKIKPEVLIVLTSVVGCDLSLAGIKEVKEKINCKVISLVNECFEEEILKRFKFVDFVIRHEWPETALDLVKYFDGKINQLESVDGIVYRNFRGEIIKNNFRVHQNINTQPLPAFDLFPMEKYLLYDIEGSVGCPHKCLFCHFGYYPITGWEGKSIDRLILEMKEMLRYGKKTFLFVDNDLSGNIEWCKKLLKKIIEEELNIEADLNIRASHVDEELMELLKKAGFRKIGIGCESGVQEILDKNAKGITLEQIKQTFELAKKYYLILKGYFLMGLWGDTKETIKTTFEFITQELKAYNTSFDIVIPFPETPFFRLLKQRGWIEELTIDNLIWIYKNLYHYPNLQSFEGKKPNWRIESLTFDDLVKIFNEYYPQISKTPVREIVKTSFREGKPLHLFIKAFKLLIKHPLIFLRILKEFIFPKKNV